MVSVNVFDRTARTTEIRPMREADIPALMAIERIAYEYPWTEGIFRDCLRVGYSGWVLSDAEGIVGYGLMSIAAGECHILNLCVHPALQGHGHGRHLLRHLLDTARSHGARLALLEVRPSNAPALALYRAFGFNEVGVRKGYYPAATGREDALILALDLA
ncbi:MAG TPA: ribosomal protein S18-alanine N-acetyltransferase [Gammaproteobacteria bacterium]|nr:ribosomal protein S18-alanine N-acetyltransferase [Gammaproteobacteria bacterium]